MRIPSDRIRSEVDQIAEIIKSVQDRIVNIPGEEIPANDLNVEIFEAQLRGELMLAAERLGALVEVLE